MAPIIYYFCGPANPIEAGGGAAGGADGGAGGGAGGEVGGRAGGRGGRAGGRGMGNRFRFLGTDFWLTVRSVFPIFCKTLNG